MGRYPLDVTAQDDLRTLHRAACEAVEALESAARMRSVHDEVQRLHSLAAAAMLVLWEAEHLVSAVESSRSEPPVEYLAPRDDEPVNQSIRRWVNASGRPPSAADQILTDLRRIDSRRASTLRLLNGPGWVSVAQLRAQLPTAGDAVALCNGAMTEELLESLGAVLGWTDSVDLGAPGRGGTP